MNELADRPVRVPEESILVHGWRLFRWFSNLRLVASSRAGQQTCPSPDSAVFLRRTDASWQNSAVLLLSDLSVQLPYQQRISDRHSRSGLRAACLERHPRLAFQTAGQYKSGVSGNRDGGVFVFVCDTNYQHRKASSLQPGSARIAYP